MSRDVDERIVQMEFDNKAFERDVSTTMSTLEKLKEALKFDKVKDTFSKISNSANKMDFSGAEEGVSSLEKRFSTLGIIGMSAINNLTNTVMDFGKRVVGGAFSSVVQGGFKRAFNIEQAKFTIEGLGKDFVQLKEDINYAVSGTAYGFDEAAKAASMMAASGIEAGDEMKASLRGISGMAAMTGDSYANIADIFGNIAGKGKLGLQEVNRFATRGINVAAKLAEQFGTTEQAIREMISKGEIDFRTFAAAMDDAFGEHATEANKTFSGAMSNIKATLARVGESFIHPLIATNDKDTLLLQTSLYKDLDERLVSIAQHADKAFEGSVNARTALNNAVRSSKKLADLSSDEIKMLIDGNEKGYLKSLKKIPELANASNEELKKIYKSDQKELEKTLAKTPEYAEKTNEELRAILATGKEQFIAQAKEMDKYAGMSDKELGKLYEQYSGFQYNAVTVMQAFMRMLKTIEGAVNRSKFLEVFIDGFSRASKVLSLFFNAVSATFSTVERAGKTYEKYLSIVDEKGKTRVISATKLWKRFGQALGLNKVDFQNLKDTVTGFLSIFKLFGDILSSVFKVAKSGSGVFKPIVSILLAFTGTLGRLTQGLVDTIRSFRIFQNVAKAIALLLNGVIYAATQVVNVLVKAFTAITDNPVLDEVVNALKMIGITVDGLFRIVYKFGKLIINAFLLPFKQLAPATDIVGNIFEHLFKTIASGLRVFNKWLQDGVTALNDFLEAFIDFGAIYDAGKKIADLFSGGLGLKEFFDSIGDMFTGMKGMGKVDLSKYFTSITTGIKTFTDFLQNIITKIDFKQIAKFLEEGLFTIAGVVIIAAEKLAEGFNILVGVLSSVDYVAMAESVAHAIKEFLKLVAFALIAIPAFIAQILADVANDISISVNADNIGIALGKVLTEGIRLVFKAIPVILTIIVRALQEVALNMPGILQEFAYDIEQVFGKTFIGMFKKLKSMLSNMSFLDVLKAINFVALYRVLMEAAKTLKAFRTLINPLEEMHSFLSSVKGVLKASNNVLKATYIRMMLVNLLLLLGGLVVISLIPFDMIINGLYKMAFVALGLWAFLKLLNDAVKLDAPDTSKTILSIAGFIAALTLLAGVTAIISQVKDLRKGVDALAGILLSIGTFIVALDKLKINPNKFKTISKAMKEFSKAMLIMSVGLAILSFLDTAKLFTSVLALGIIIGTLTLCSQKLQGAGLKSLAAIGPALLAMSAGLAILSMFDFKTLATSVGALVIMIIALTGAAAVIGKMHLDVALGALSAAFIAFGVGVLAFSAGVYLVVSALHTLGMMGQSGEIEGLKKSISELANLIPLVIGKIGEGLVLAAQAIGEGALTIINALLDLIQTALEATLERALTFADLGIKIIVTILTGILSGIGQIADTAIKIVTTFVDTVSANMGPIVNSGVNLIISFINGVADALSKNGEKIWKAVANLMGAILELVVSGIQVLLKKIPGGDVIAKKLDPAKKAIRDFFGDGTVNKETEKGADKMAKSVEQGSKKASNSAKKNLKGIPDSAKKATNDSIKQFKGLDKKIGDPFAGVVKASDLSKDLKANAEKSGKAYKSGIDNTKGLSESGKGLGHKVSNAAGGGDIIGSLRNGGSAVGQGYVNGIKAKWDDAYRAGYTLGSKAKQGEKDATKHSSPSKELYKAGRFVGQGYVNGISSFFTKVYQTGKTMGLESVEGVSGAIRQITDMVQDGIDTTPTIRPVLDLSSVKMGVDSMSRMFDSNQYALNVAGQVSASGIGLGNKTMNITNNLTVNGAEDPKKWADEFAQELEIQARTM